MKKLIWLWKCFWGKRLIIKVSDELKEDEILIYGCCLYLPQSFCHGTRGKCDK